MLTDKQTKTRSEQINLLVRMFSSQLSYQADHTLFPHHKFHRDIEADPLSTSKKNFSMRGLSKTLTSNSGIEYLPVNMPSEFVICVASFSEIK